MNILAEFKKTLNEVELVEFSKFEKRLNIFLERYKDIVYLDILKEFYVFSLENSKKVKQLDSTQEHNKTANNGFNIEDFINPKAKELFVGNEQNIKKEILNKIKNEFKQNKE